MPDKEKRVFSHKELTEILVKQAGIHKGHWGLYVEFGLGAGNIPVAGPDGAFSMKPAAIVPINGIGIVEFDEPSPITTNAAEVNPTPDMTVGARRPRKRTSRS